MLERTRIAIQAMPVIRRYPAQSRNYAFVAALILTGIPQLSALVREPDEQSRSAAYVPIAITDQIRSGDMHVVLIDGRFVGGDGPLLGLPPKPYKYPQFLHDIIRGTQAAVVAEVARSEGRLTTHRNYIQSTVTLRVSEVIRRGTVVREGTELVVDQDGGSVTIDGVRVELTPMHIRMIESGQKYLVFVRESAGVAEALNTYLLAPGGVLRSLDLLKRPKGYDDPLDGKTLGEIRQDIRK